MTTRMTAHREAVAALREQTRASKRRCAKRPSNLRRAARAATTRSAYDGVARRLPARLVEESAREQAESAQAEEAAARHSAAEEQRTAAMRAVEIECSELAGKSRLPSRRLHSRKQARRNWEPPCAKHKHALWTAARTAGNRTEAGAHARRAFRGTRARRTSIEQILSERAYTADAVQKLFNVNGERGARHARRRVSRGGLARGLRRSAGKVRRRDRTIPARRIRICRRGILRSGARTESACCATKWADVRHSSWTRSTN